MKPRQTLTPAMMRTRYHEQCAAPKPVLSVAEGSGKVDPAKPCPELSRRMPPLAAEIPREVDATLAWLAHTCPEPRRRVRHGRILVRGLAHARERALSANFV